VAGDDPEANPAGVTIPSVTGSSPANSPEMTGPPPSGHVRRDETIEMRCPGTSGISSRWRKVTFVFSGLVDHDIFFFS
jgi:hypothetical protein